MSDDQLSENAPGRASGTTDSIYTILISTFRAPLRLSPDTLGTARIDLELDVPHPGPGFADDIASVMSYEEVVRGLRALCDETPHADARCLAEAVAALALSFPCVRQVRVSASVVPFGFDDRKPSMPNDTVSVTRDAATAHTPPGRAVST